MRLSLRRICKPAIGAYIVLALIACQRKNSALIDGLYSYETLKDARDHLNKKTPTQVWIEEQRPARPDDKRPPHSFAYISGEFQDLGSSGRLRLTFYNGRLIEAAFSPSDGSGYLSALQKSGVPVPSTPGTDVRISDRTKFRYQNVRGSIVCYWVDTTLEQEWNDWVEKYS